MQVWIAVSLHMCYPKLRLGASDMRLAPRGYECSTYGLENIVEMA